MSARRVLRARTLRVGVRGVRSEPARDGAPLDYGLVLSRRHFVRVLGGGIGFAAASLADRGGPYLAVAANRGARGAAPSVGRARHLEIFWLDTPTWTEVGVPFRVHVAAADDRGLAAIEIDFDGKSIRLDARGRKTARLSVQLETGEARFKRLGAVAIGLDGTRGSRRSTVVAVAASDALPVPGRRQSVSRKLEDSRSARVGGGPVAPVPGQSKVPKPSPKGALPPLTAVDPWWIRWRADGGGKPFDPTAACAPGTHAITPFGEVLRCWLGLYPQVAQALVWEEVDPKTGTTTPKAYPDWTDTQKIQLDQAVFWAWEWLDNGLTVFNGEYLVDPPDNQITLKDCASVRTALTMDSAWKLYLGTVAHSLALEIGGFVPWSVVGYTTPDLETLFHSMSMFDAGTVKASTLNCPGGDIDFTGYTVDGYVIPAPATRTFEFLVKDSDFVRWDHQQTIARLLEWARAHMEHYAGEPTAKNMQAFFKYRGDAPASRIMTGTTYVDPDFGFTVGPASWSPMGCHGVAYFFRAVMRGANIPVRYFYICGHGVPVFWTIGRTMTHGDDIYARYVKVTPPFPAEQLLITTSEFNTLFFEPIGDCGNIGRRIADVLLSRIPLPGAPHGRGWGALIPIDLVELYCTDVSQGLSHAAGSVYAIFMLTYTVSFLETRGLWTALAAKATELGLC